MKTVGREEEEMTTVCMANVDLKLYFVGFICTIIFLFTGWSPVASFVQQ